MATAKLYAPTGEEKGTIELPEATFGSPIHRHVMWEVVRNYLANMRQGTVMTKTRRYGERRREEALRPEEDRARARGNDPLPDLGRRRPGARSQAAQLLL